MPLRHKATSKLKYIVGIDEAGRGPLAGPVSVGAVAIPSVHLGRARRVFAGVKESKQLAASERESWLKLMKAEAKAGRLHFCATFSANTVIDRKGITWAIKSALRRGLASLEKRGVASSSAKVLLDGGLKAPGHFADQTTIIKGDEKEMVIALASIAAKVRRDRHMAAAARIYAGYGFEIHKGYGTKLHAEALRRHGPCPIHRSTFLKMKQR